MKNVSHWPIGVTLMMIALLAPAQAQSDQNIVMRCTFDGYTNQTLDYVLDLAAKTMSLTHTITGMGQLVVQHYSGRVTQVADDKINWTYSDTTRTVTDTLNRYSGQIVSQVAISAGGNITVLQSCTRQQKQF